MYLWPHRVSYDQLTEEERTQAWFTDDSVWYSGTTWKWTVLELLPLSGTSLKVSGEEEVPLGRTLNSAPGCSVFLERVMARHVIIYQFMDYDQWFDWLVRYLEGTQLENWWQRDLEKRYVDRVLWMAEEYEDICIPCECSSKGDLSRRGILIIRWVGWSSLWILASLFSQPRLSLPQGSWTK